MPIYDINLCLIREEGGGGSNSIFIRALSQFFIFYLFIWLLYYFLILISIIIIVNIRQLGKTKMYLYYLRKVNQFNCILRLIVSKIFQRIFLKYLIWCHSTKLTKKMKNYKNSIYPYFSSDKIFEFFNKLVLLISMTCIFFVKIG